MALEKMNFLHFWGVNALTATTTIAKNIHSTDLLQRLTSFLCLFYRSSWRTRMGADSSDSVPSVSGDRRRGHGDASPLSKVSII